MIRRTAVLLIFLLLFQVPGITQEDGDKPPVKTASLRILFSDLSGFEVRDDSGSLLGTITDAVITREGSVPFVFVRQAERSSQSRKDMKISTEHLVWSLPLGAGFVLKTEESAGQDGKFPEMYDTSEHFTASSLRLITLPGRGGIGYRIEDLMIDPENWDVAYAALIPEGSMGSGETFHAVPWSALEIRSREGGFSIGAPEHTGASPVFDSRNWPAEPDLFWNHQSGNGK